MGLPISVSNTNFILYTLNPKDIYFENFLALYFKTDEQDPIKLGLFDKFCDHIFESGIPKNLFLTIKI